MEDLQGTHHVLMTNAHQGYTYAPGQGYCRLQYQPVALACVIKLAKKSVRRLASYLNCFTCAIHLR